MIDTTGKTVTLRLGAVVTDIGPGVANGQIDPIIRNCICDDGTTTQVVARIIRELPTTHRRAFLPPHIYNADQIV